MLSGAFQKLRATYASEYIKNRLLRYGTWAVSFEVLDFDVTNQINIAYFRIFMI